MHPLNMPSHRSIQRKGETAMPATKTFQTKPSQKAAWPQRRRFLIGVSEGRSRPPNFTLGWSRTPNAAGIANSPSRDPEPAPSVIAAPSAVSALRAGPLPGAPHTMAPRTPAAGPRAWRAAGSAHKGGRAGPEPARARCSRAPRRPPPARARDPPEDRAMATYFLDGPGQQALQQPA